MLEYCFGQTPLGFFLSGNSGVMIFLILTGFGSYIVCDRGKESCVKYASLRFFKLSVLMFLSTIIIWLLFKLNFVYYNNLAEKTSTIWMQGYAPFQDNILSLIFGNWFTISNNYNATLWTMQSIFASSIICVLLYCLWGNLHKGYLIPTGIIGLLFLIMGMQYYLPCLLGYMLAYYFKKKPGRSINAISGIAILLLGIFLCGFPMVIEPQFILYRFFPQKYVFYYHIIGAFLLAYACLFCLPIKKMFECKLFLILGKYSMSAYILHFAVLISATSYLFIKITDKLSYNRSVLLLWMITTVGTYAVAIPVKKMIDIIYKSLDKGYQKLFEYMEK